VVEKDYRGKSVPNPVTLFAGSLGDDLNRITFTAISVEISREGRWRNPLEFLKLALKKAW
jgi:hypothetical protein